MKKFEPHYTITNKTANALVRIEAVRQQIEHLPIHPVLLISLRESAKLYSTHYSTMIEGNRLTQEQVTTWGERKQTSLLGSTISAWVWPVVSKQLRDEP